ncbi:MAG: hypothetical protein E6Q97_11990 [Desulfurellales bacterium]|nr:MAG: hypothetical protein E6Q97_11990 [Desulfurellales bacterium]
MAPFNEIGGTNAVSTSAATGAADTLPNAAAPEPFAASVRHAANETAHCDRLVPADPFNLLHGGSYD